MRGWIDVPGVALGTELDCMPGDGYSDWAEGSRVTVKDGRGETVGLLDVSSSWAQTPAGAVGVPVLCRMAFHGNGIPSGRGFYSLHAGRRPPLELPEAEARENIALTLK